MLKIVEYMKYILVIDGVGCLLLSRKLVWFTDDGIFGRGCMICTWGNFQMLFSLPVIIYLNSK